MDPIVPRVRFAPSPTGLMHLGNVRAALLNYLFAHKTDGVFVLRIEDTDVERNSDPGAKKIILDLKWLGLTPNEGPEQGGPYAPYFQSERTNLYQEQIEHLQKLGQIYRCFCTAEELEKKRQRQIALKQPPRYDRTCLHRSSDEITELIAEKVPFIWRVKLDHAQTVTIHDLGHGTIAFELKNFSDFAITRQDGSFTFMFANFVDDMLMKITHIFRGEDHLSNTAGQAALYTIYQLPLPAYYHLPIICNIDGKKLSKRDFGFALDDLQQAGYLPEAILNYLTIIGGGTFQQEIMSLPELARAYDFDKVHSTGHIRYDVEKLRWMNHKWIERLDSATLTTYCKPFIITAYPQAVTLSDEALSLLIQGIKTDLISLKDSVHLLNFYFNAPHNTAALLKEHIPHETVALIAALISKHLSELDDAHLFLENIKREAKLTSISIKHLFTFLRIALMDAPQGPGILEIITILGAEEARKRLKTAL